MWSLYRLYQWPCRLLIILHHAERRYLLLKTIEIKIRKKKIYDICLDDSYGHLAEKLIETGIKGRKVCIVTDSHVAPLYLK